MLTSIDVARLTFGQPYFLWLLVVPAACVCRGLWLIGRRRGIARRAVGSRALPVRERYTLGGHTWFWLCLVAAASFCIMALARPQAPGSIVRRAGADFVLLQDASASMYVRDVDPDRWQRSVAFLRTFASTLGWRGERLALALFAHLASPQVRLTKDPTAFFFFLDHLGRQSPFRLEDDPTWDTNIAEGLHWGLNMLEKDEELFGKSANVKAFVVISDGQAWSGDVAMTLARARRRDAPVYVVGVGTTTGAMIPKPAAYDPSNPPPTTPSVLDRDSLRSIARAGGGEYYELGVEPDRDVAARIIASVKRRAGVAQVVSTGEELYWQFLLAAAVALCLGTLLLREAATLWWQAVAALATLLTLTTLPGLR
jgi:Ca-activated chloride channel family protein